MRIKEIMEAQKIRPIPNEFKANGGMSYKLIRRTKLSALYKVNDYGWEVHKIRICIATDTIFHASMRAAGYTHYEKLASNEDFGQYGWYYPIDDLKRAEDKYSEVSNA
jgi:hypothetical protein